MEEVLAKLSPKTRKRVLAAQDIKVEKIQTPSAGLNSALAGGIALGRQTLIWGNKSAGKSSLCLQIIARAQAEGKVCAWIDAEGTFDPDWAVEMGVDVENLIVSPAKSINEMTKHGVELIEAGVDVLVVDSISALLPSVYFEKDSDDLKEIEASGQIGSEAKDMTKAVKMLNYKNENTALIFISQVRKSFGAMYASNIPTGGEAVKFFSSTIIKLWSSDSDANAIKQKLPSGDKLIEEKVGRSVNWIIEFNKVGAPGQSGAYDFYFRGPHLGVDTVADTVDIAEKLGVISRSGSWYDIEGIRMQGRAAVIEQCREDSELLGRLQKGIDEA